MSKEKKDTRTRNYTTILYPESAVENWLEILQDTHIPMFISPLHDSDVSANNEPKKAHYHIMVMFDGPKTLEQAREVFEPIGGVGCEVVKSLRAMARYFCHLDDANKHQYNIDDVMCLGGADYRIAIGTMADKTQAIREMLAFIVENDCTCFADLMMYASINRSDWFDCLINSGAYVIKEFIKSYTWKEHHTEEK